MIPAYLEDMSSHVLGIREINNSFKNSKNVEHSVSGNISFLIMKNTCLSILVTVPARPSLGNKSSK